MRRGSTMALTRRELLAACAATLPSLATRSVQASAGGDRPPLGVVIHSYGLRSAASSGRDGAERFDDALVFLEYCHTLGARGVQVGIGVRDEAACERLRARASACAMDLEGSVRLPR